MIYHLDKDVSVTSWPMAGTLVLSITTPEKYDDFHKYLNRALNTADDAPQWLFKLCDCLEKNPIPERGKPG